MFIAVGFLASEIRACYTARQITRWWFKGKSIRPVPCLASSNQYDSGSMPFYMQRFTETEMCYYHFDNIFAQWRKYHQDDHNPVLT